MTSPARSTTTAETDSHWLRTSGLGLYLFDDAHPGVGLHRSTPFAVGRF